MTGWYEPEDQAFPYRRASELIRLARIPREQVTDEVVEVILAILNDETPGVPSTPIGEENQEETAT
jgi:hypothetical protein